MKVHADRDLCIGAGVCTSVTSVFTLADDGKVMLATADVPPDEVAGVEEAVALCPVQALSLETDHRSGDGSA